MLHTIKKVQYLEGYKLRLQFDDKSLKVVDLSNMLKNAKNMLLPLRDIEYFKQVECDGITILWPNGVDFCPDMLYKMGKSIARAKPRKILRISKSRKKAKLKSS